MSTSGVHLRFLISICFFLNGRYVLLHIDGTFQAIL